MGRAVNDNAAPDRETRRRKLFFRAWHRGTKEMDILIGEFAKARIDSMTDAELDGFEMLLHMPDQDLYAILVSNAPVPAEDSGPVMDALIDYARTREAPR